MPVVRREGIDIHYETTGTGPPIVLLHGLLFDGAMWAAQVGPLSERYRVLNVDARGHGKSDRCDRPYSLYDSADDVVAVLDAEGVERAVWAGLSIGGMTALCAAVAQPARVRALILLDTNGGREPAWQHAKFRALGAGARLLGVKPLSGAIAKEMFGTTTLRVRRQLVREWKSQVACAHVPSVLRALDALLRRDDLTHRLQEITIPALVGVGTEDHAQPPSRSRRLADGLQQATYVEFDRAGHMTSLEQPDAVTRAMLEFLAAVYGTSTHTH